MRPQAIRILRLLIEEGRPMTARRIAQKMGISQQNVYRLMEQLKQRNLIRSGPIIEQVYAAKPSPHAYAAYIGWARREFEQLFGEAYHKAAEKRKKGVQ